MDWAMGVAARTLLQEARNQPSEGQIAVAWVIKNRLASGRWGNSLATVCLWHAQFSGWYSPRGNPPVLDPNFAFACGLRDDDPMLGVASGIIQAAIDGAEDPTDGARFYYAPAGMPEGKAPPWAGTMRYCGKFGSQLFYSDVASKALTS
jgi:spore germination cell wall hydrolase CwlJ-like protein